MNMLQVGYCSWLLLLWLTALYLVTGLGGQDNTLRFLHIIFPWRTKCLHINYLQEPDPWYRPARHGLHHPQLPHGAVLHHLLIPQQLKMLQVLYIGGSKVSLPDACADVFGPRCSPHLICDVNLLQIS